MEDLVVVSLALAVAGFITVVVLIHNHGKNKIKQTEIQAINSQSFEKFAKEIREENASLKSELNEVKESLSSINKMLKDVE